jgi:ankyrin repeat protein
VLLQLVDPNVLSGLEDVQSEEMRLTPLHDLAKLADPFDYSTHENQLVLATQLIEHGANVNAVSIPQGASLLHLACSGVNVTNLDFVELLLEKGADPNFQDHGFGLTPLMCTVPDAPGAAKFLLKWSTTDVNITTRTGVSFLVKVRSAITEISDKVALPDNLERVQHQFLLQQWRDIEVMVVEKGAQDTGIAALD